MLFSEIQRCRGEMEWAMKISDDAWASSLAAPTPADGDDHRGPRFAMNQSPLEWQLENVVAAPTSPTSPSPTPDHIPKSISCAPPSDPCGGAVQDGEMMEIETPVSVDDQPSNPFAGVDPQEYASLLKRKLDLYCAAVAMSRRVLLPSFSSWKFLFLGNYQMLICYDRVPSSCSKHFRALSLEDFAGKLMGNFSVLSNLRQFHPKLFSFSSSRIFFVLVLFLLVRPNLRHYSFNFGESFCWVSKL